MNQSPAVPLLGRCEHASRRLVLMQIHLRHIQSGVLLVHQQPGWVWQPQIFSMLQTGQAKPLFNSFIIRKLRTDLHLDQLSYICWCFKLTCWYGNRTFRNVFCEWLRACRHTICHYMRKMKLKYQHVHPAPTLHINAVDLVCVHPFLYRLAGYMVLYLHLLLVFNFIFVHS